MRLGQRRIRGVAGPLQLGALEEEGNVLRLTLASQHQALFGEAVERRLRQLAGAMELAHQFTTRNQTSKLRHSRNGAVWAPSYGCQPMRQSRVSPSLFMALVTILFASYTSLAVILGAISFPSSTLHRQ